MPQHRRRWIAAVTAAMLALTAACSSPTSDNPWSAEFQQAREQTVDSPQAQAILSDNVITEQEYAEIQQHYLDCLTAEGFPGAQITGPKGEMEIPWNGKDPEAATKKCGEGTGWDAITFLYGSIQENPGNEHPDTAMVNCLKRHDVVDPAMSPEQYAQQVQEFMENNTPGPDVDLSSAIRYTDPERGPEIFYACMADVNS